MDPRAQEHYEEKLKQVIENIETQNPFKKVKVDERSKFQFTNGIAFSLIDENLDKFEELKDKLLNSEGLNDRFSSSYLEKLLKDAIANVIKKVDENETNLRQVIKKEFDEIIEKYKNTIEYKVFVPLQGIEMCLDKYEVGNIILINMKEERIDDLVKQTKKMLENNPYYENNEGKIDRIVKHTEDTLNKLKNNTCAIYSIEGDHIKAKNEAEKQIQKYLSLFRYAKTNIYPGKQIDIGLKGETNSSIRTTPIISDEKYHIKSETIGGFMLFEISKETKDKMDKLEINKLANMIKNEDSITKFEKKLLNSIYWYSNSEINRQKENKFLDLMNGLEVLFSIEGNVSSSLAYGISHAYSQKLKEQNKLFKVVKDLYKIRCDIVHNGKKNIKEEDLNKLRYISQEVINNLVKDTDKFKNIFDISERLFGN